MSKKKIIKRKIFVGSVGWLIFWIIVFWPIALIYYLSDRDEVELKKVKPK